MCNGALLRISVGKYALREALDVVFSPGEPLLLWKKAPEGFIEGILERYGRSCKETLAMRNVHIKLGRISSKLTFFTDFWINAYYTSFPCHQCSGYDDAEEDHEVFHLTSPEARQCLSLNYTTYKHIEVVNCRAKCHGTHVTIQQMRVRPVLRSSGIRYEAFRLLPRMDLDTCLLVNKFWKTEVDELSPKLALHELGRLTFTYNTEMKSTCFTVCCDGDGYSILRAFTIPRNATVDSAIAVNHLRNCTTFINGFEFVVGRKNYEEGNLKLDYSVRLWITNLLCSMKDSNFHFNGLYLRLGRVNPSHAIDFFFSSSIALPLCVTRSGLRSVSLGFNYEALEDLVEEGFLQLPYVQNLEEIELSISVFGPDPPGDHSWIRGLFQLPNCKKILIKYNPSGQPEPDCSEHIFGVLRETIKHFESASDVSGFPDNFEFVLRQDELTWNHQEPPPAYSSVSVPLLDGLWNVYVTNNIATDVPLSVYVNTEENCQGDDGELSLERRFIFRKELCVHEPAKTSRFS